MGKQLALFPVKRKRRGGKPGRKVRGERVGFVRHRTRPAHDRKHPVHVTIRRVRLAPSFRTQRIGALILQELKAARAKGVRVIEHSIQDDHLHLMVEGNDAADLSAQMRTLFSRIAMTINQAAGRRGSLFRDRHHRHELTTPREVRNALVYILFNARKHGDAGTVRALEGAVDPYSSAPWFQGWAEETRPPPIVGQSGHLPESPLSAPHTWLARVGWRRGGGAIRFHESPRRPR